jgi:hypothetical protein
MYFDLGFQYYVAGRCGVATWLNPVAANLLHHAVEMFLKGALSAHTTEDERKAMRHDLRRIWKAFKGHYNPAANFNHFDAVIHALHKYEEIRYPEKIIRDGMGSYFQFGKPTPIKISGKAANVPKYQLFVADIDALVKASCDMGSINAKAFTNKYQEPGKTYLRHENVETGLF